LFGINFAHDYSRFYGNGISGALGNNQLQDGFSMNQTQNPFVYNQNLMQQMLAYQYLMSQYYPIFPFQNEPQLIPQFDANKIQPENNIIGLS
jgi:hypothetical protein